MLLTYLGECLLRSGLAETRAIGSSFGAELLMAVYPIYLRHLAVRTGDGAHPVLS